MKFLLNNFGKSEKSASKIPKVRGGSEAFGKNSYLSHIFLPMASLRKRGFPINAQIFKPKYRPVLINAVVDDETYGMGRSIH